MARKGVQIKNKGLFSSSTVTSFAAPSARASFDGFTSTSGSIASGSYELSAPGSPLSSTQQLPIDWSKFERHTFFDSAESKVNVTFDTFINYFPFDSSIEEIRKYFDGLTGYEKYVYDNLWPKSLGYLHFSGTQKNEDPDNGYDARQGTHISVVDQAGHLYPSISSRKDSAAIIDFSSSPFSCMFHVNLPELDVDTYNSVIIQKLLPNNHGFSIFVSGSSASSETSDIVFTVSSGSMAMSASAAFSRSSTKFEHCAVVLSRRQNENCQLLIYKDGVLAATSSQTIDLGRLDFVTASLLIGSGTNHYLGTYSTTFESETTLSGTLDDLRLYAAEKNVSEIKSIASGSATFGTDMLAYYKFNEATGSYDNNGVVLDHSGNSLHAQITNYSSTLRDTTWGAQSLSYPVVNESLEYNPVLFPSHPTLASLNTSLLSAAANYDANNPNLITKMIPKHYLEEEAAVLGYSNAKAGLGEAYSSTTDFPGGGDIGSPQLIASLLFMWAKFFDEVKLFIDHFGSMLRIDYDDSGTIADVMLPFFAKYYGISLPNMFSDSTVEQYLRGSNTLTDPGNSEYSLAKIQAIIWRRILINVQDSIRSKGTIHGIKAIMRATGIDPDLMFRFRESGGPRELNLNTNRIFRSQTSSLLKFSNDGTLTSPFLSGSRIEVGVPEPRGSFVQKTTFKPHGISDWRWDGMMTSGSWTTEFLVKANTPALISSMSLSRMSVTGTDGEAVIANCVAVGVGEYSTTKTGSLSVFHRPTNDSSLSAVELVLTGTDIFDGDVWHVSYGRDIKTGFTSSYFLRAGKQNNGELTVWSETTLTASFTNLDVSPNVNDYYSSGSTQSNVSGSFLQFGTGSFDTTTTFGLNDTSGISDYAKLANFSGSIGRVRFWSKALTSAETKEHVHNFTSLGVEDPLLNFGFVNEKSGSYERLRIDAQCDQAVTRSDGSGEISIFDYSQNLFHLTGTSFPVSSQVLNPEDFQYSMLNPKFDERSTTNKVRIAGYTQDSNVELYNSLKSPVRSIPLGTPVEDDTKFSIEISTSKALNDDIVVLLGSLEWFNNALGSPELMFAQEYPDLESLRNVYFNRLTDKINYKNLLSFYKWVDTTIGFLIDSMIPSNTSYQGMNFVIESHMLERNKMRYLQEDIYLGENDRRGLQTDLGLQQVVGSMKRY